MIEETGLRVLTKRLDDPIIPPSSGGVWYRERYMYTDANGHHVNHVYTTLPNEFIAMCSDNVYSVQTLEAFARSLQS